MIASSQTTMKANFILHPLNGPSIRSIIGYYCGVARPRSLETLVVYSDSAPMILGGAARRARLACPNSCCAPKVGPDASYAGLMPADSVCFGFVTRTASTQETHRNRK
jgi:hypothetical protein